MLILYKHGLKLVRYQTSKSRLLREQVTESQFADELALYTVTRKFFESEGCASGKFLWSNCKLA